MKQSHASQKEASPSPADVPLGELPVVEVTDRMYQLAQHIAAARATTYSPIDGGVVYGDQDSEDAHLTGVLGELAYQEYQQPEDAEQAIYVYGDPGYDSTHEGETLDVKATATHMTIPDLLIPYRQNLTAEKYLLAHRVNPREIRLVGLADRETVKDRAPERHPGSSLNYVVKPHELQLL